MTSPLLQPIIRPVLGDVIHRVMPPYFVPIDLFNTGQQGAWYDPSDVSTLFQDEAGTTPVTAVDQPVGLMLDKSGRGNHAFTPSASSTSRPLWKLDENNSPYLLFDGNNDWMQTNSINFTTTDKVTVFAAVRKLSDAAAGILVEFSDNSVGNNGTFALLAPATGATYGFRSKGNSLAALTVTPSTFASPVTSVLTGIGSILPAQQDIRVNGAVSSTSTENQGSGKYGNYPLYIGARAGASLWFNGRLYGLTVSGAQSTTEQIVETEKWLAQKTGVTV